ncbi:MAG: hypothetical protein GX970_10810 [Phyllobacteriaceae bacterium]|nr:hypothetical protein [Phyllobacteriaceae bacterium]
MTAWVHCQPIDWRETTLMSRVAPRKSLRRPRFWDQSFVPLLIVLILAGVLVFVVFR